MENTLLDFFTVKSRPDLVPDSVYNAIKRLTEKYQEKDFLVAEIDPDFAGGAELCAKYKVDPAAGANCLVVNGIRGENKTFAACLVPVGCRYDMSGVVRKSLNARQVSVASLNYVITQTHMEYGSITPIGLPNNWLLFIDPSVFKHERIIIGGGLKKSKLSIPSASLLELPNAIELVGLAKFE